MSAIMTDDELAAAVAEWAKHRGPMTLAWKLADHFAATHGAKAEPQPVPVSPLALAMIQAAAQLATKMSITDAVHAAAIIANESIAAAARIEGGVR